MPPIDTQTRRRHFLKWISASPLLAAPGMRALAAPQCIASPQAARSVFDFEPVCRNNVPPAHFEYMASGVDDKIILCANREALLACELEPPHLSGALNLHTRMEIFGTRYASPICLAPTGGNTAYHPDGELAVARAARAANHLSMLAAGATASIDDVIAARGGPMWYQLYAASSWVVARALAGQAEAAGAQAVVVTLNGGRDGSQSTHWDFVRRLRDTTPMRMVLKGILTAEDAALAVQHGVDGIIVSNHGGHGGHGEGSGTIDALPAVIAAVNDRLPVLIDGGFRRGSDVVKALAMGARGVCIGRPYLWGLGAFGQAGVERVLELLRIETRAAMQQCGERSIKDLNASFVRKH
ncbi:MAG TPA: alpha-hydroxy-acid oxidizing protein [Burkholderiales bacterium]|nr:alpha-hydroxy-acid oxidizing protein [Burkholderiales bacterium]